MRVMFASTRGAGHILPLADACKRAGHQVLIAGPHATLEWRPDVIVRETSELGSAVAAELEAIPHAWLATGLAVDAPRSAPCFSFFPASLEEQSEAIRLRDPAWDAWPIPLPASWWRGSSDPLVYVTFGSGSFAQTAPLFTAAMRALTALPVRVLMAVGHDVALEAL